MADEVPFVPQAIVTLTLLPTSEGGLARPRGAGPYNPHIEFELGPRPGRKCLRMIVGEDGLGPGATAGSVPARFLDPEGVVPYLPVGATYGVFEGGRRVGTIRVTSVDR